MRIEIAFSDVLENELYDSFTHLYCRIYERKYFAGIWKKRFKKLLTDKSVENLMLNWNIIESLRMQNDLLGCILRNNKS